MSLSSGIPARFPSNASLKSANETTELLHQFQPGADNTTQRIAGHRPHPRSAPRVSACNINRATSILADAQSALRSMEELAAEIKPTK
jgi:hypothetical protein